MTWGQGYQQWGLPGHRVIIDIVPFVLINNISGNTAENSVTVFHTVPVNFDINEKVEHFRNASEL